MPNLAKRWSLPQFDSVVDLAEWLRVSPARLDWLADCQMRQRQISSGPLTHYVYHWVPKRSGGSRLIESPKSTLKEIQRVILQEILNRAQPHPAAHGFRKRRSVVSYVRPHIGSAALLRMDLSNFFPSISGARVKGIFQTLGYSESVAHMLSALCTNSVPRTVLEEYPRDRYAFVRNRLPQGFDGPHLPQGAPTSPALANLCAYRLDCRLAGLAESAGGRYTRYADDLLCSGDEPFARQAHRLMATIAEICSEENFRMQMRKTRVMRPGVRQHAAGVVLNTKLNVRRTEYDQLKAMLHNCRRFGPVSQNKNCHANFRAHLAGKIAHVTGLNPNRGQKLQAIFDQIEWETKSPSVS